MQKENPKALCILLTGLEGLDSTGAGIASTSAIVSVWALRTTQELSSSLEHCSRSWIGS